MTNAIKNAVDNRVKNLTKGGEKFVALLGDHDGLVEVGNGLVYITLINSGQVMQVVNRRSDTPNDAGRYVEVGYANAKSTTLEVLGFRNVYANDTAPRIVRHRDTHSEFGSDRVPIGAGQFLPLLALPAGGFIVQIYGGMIRKRNSDGLIRVDSQEVDLSSYVPSAGALYVVIEADDDGVLSVAVGDTVASIDALDEAVDIPSADGYTIIPVSLYDGQAELLREKYYSDFVETRFAGLGVLRDENGLYISFKNQSGSVIEELNIVMMDGVLGASDLVKGILAITDGTYSARYILGVSLGAVENGDKGRAYTFIERKNIDTTGTVQGEVWSDGDILYNNPAVNGGMSNIEPSAPNLNLPIAVIKLAHANGSLITRTIQGFNLEELHNVNGTVPVNEAPLLWSDVDNYWDANNSIPIDNNFFNGTFQEPFDARVRSTDGINVLMSLEKSGGGNLMMRFSDGWTPLVCTPALEIALTPGTDAIPTDSYIYIPQSTKILTLSTSGFPAQSVEHIKVGYFYVPSAATVQSDGGAFVNQNWNDERAGSSGMGHLAHIGQKMRHGIGVTYRSGLDGTITINGANDVDFAMSSGIIEQLHEQILAAQNTATGSDIHVINHSGGANTRITNLGSLVDDASGGTLTNRYFNLFIAVSANKTGEYSPLLLNLPEGTYNSLADAVNDVDGYDVTSLPAAYTQNSSNGVSLYIYTFRKTSAGGGTWTLENTQSLREGNGVGGGGTITPQQDFSDAAFSIFNSVDPTKIIVTDASAIATGTIRTIYVPDEDVVLGNISLNTTHRGVVTGNPHNVLGAQLGDDVFVLNTGDEITGDILINSGSTAALTVKDSDNAFVVDTVNGRVELSGDIEASIFATTFSNSLASQSVYRRARGTTASPTAVQSGDSLGAFSFRGHTGSGFTGSKAFIGVSASENWTPTANGSKFFLATTPIGSTTLISRFILGSDDLVINEGAYNYDIRIEGMTNTNLFRTDAGTDMVGIGTYPTAKLHVKGTANVRQFTVQAHSTQTANIVEYQDYLGVVLSSIDGSGAFQPVTLTDVSAPNNSIYYSSTASKLVYKDAGGTVNNLY